MRILFAFALFSCTTQTPVQHRTESLQEKLGKALDSARGAPRCTLDVSLGYVICPDLKPPGGPR